MKLLLSVFLVQLIGLSSLAGPFQVPSQDGLSQISGQIDIPNCNQAMYPAVFMVGGTGFFSRNVFFGRSRTSRDFVFADLAQRFTAACIAVVRFDFRGVTCDLTDKSKLQTCVDQNLRTSVTDETILDDIQAVYNFAISSKSIDPSRFFMLGHSEGSLNIARLIARKSIHPAGILFFGGITESAKSILHWQIVDRAVEWSFEMDSNSDGTLTNAEIKSNFSKSKFNGSIPIDMLINPTGSWNKTSLVDFFEKTYQSITDDTLAKSDLEPYQIGGVIFSAYKWWKRWFEDDISALENLRDFYGPIKYHNGDIDSQAPGLREKAILDSSQIKMRSTPVFQIHPGKGHGLGSDPLYGPIDESIADEIVSDIHSWAKVAPVFSTDKVRHWSEDLSKGEVAAPYLATFKDGKYELRYLGSRHENSLHSPTLELVDKTFKTEKINAVVIEPYPYSKGESSAWFLDYIKKNRHDDFLPLGEAALSALLADERGIPFFGGEPTDEDILQQISSEGFSPSELVISYLVRQIPQWKREGELEKQKYEVLASSYLSATCRNLNVNPCPTLRDAEQWYTKMNGKILTEDVDSQESAPLVDSPLGTQRISSAITLVRDRFTLKIIEKVLAKYERVLVVYGHSHFLDLQPAFEDSMGHPSYSR